MKKSDNNPTPDERWYQGVEHDPRSEEVYEALNYFDRNYGAGVFEFRAGGDGDNGEELMYLLDMYFHEKDKGKHE